MACLAPSFLPALFFVTAVLQIVKPFPFGIVGIILIHTLMYAGLVGLLLQFIFVSKFQKLSEQAYIEGATQFQFIFSMFRNMYFELAMIFLFLFVHCVLNFCFCFLLCRPMHEITFSTIDKPKLLSQVPAAFNHHSFDASLQAVM